MTSAMFFEEHFDFRLSTPHWYILTNPYLGGEEGRRSEGSKK